MSDGTEAVAALLDALGVDASEVAWVKIDCTGIEIEQYKRTAGGIVKHHQVWTIDAQRLAAATRPAEDAPDTLET